MSCFVRGTSRFQLGLRRRLQPSDLQSPSNVVMERGRTAQPHGFQDGCKNLMNVNELNHLINFLEKEEISGMRQMELKVLPTVISRCVTDAVTSSKIPSATGMGERGRARFTLLIV